MPRIIFITISGTQNCISGTALPFLISQHCHSSILFNFCALLYHCHIFLVQVAASGGNPDGVITSVEMKKMIPRLQTNFAFLLLILNSDIVSILMKH